MKLHLNEILSKIEFCRENFLMPKMIYPNMQQYYNSGPEIPKIESV